VATPDPGSGAEPDYRYSLANERTFLSWIRTSLALIAGGIALKTFAKDLQPQWLPVVAGLAATVLGGLLATMGYLHWRRVQWAMRHGEPLPRQVAALILTIGIVILAVVLAIGILI
jgi:putative membrane protein